MKTKTEVHINYTEIAIKKINNKINRQIILWKMETDIKTNKWINNIITNAYKKLIKNINKVTIIIWFENTWKKTHRT